MPFKSAILLLFRILSHTNPNNILNCKITISLLLQKVVICVLYYFYNDIMYIYWETDNRYNCNYLLNRKKFKQWNLYMFNECQITSLSLFWNIHSMTMLWCKKTMKRSRAQWRTVYWLAAYLVLHASKYSSSNLRFCYKSRNVYLHYCTPKPLLSCSFSCYAMPWRT